MMDTRLFIEALYNDKADDAFILLWEQGTHRSYWAKNIDQAVKVVEGNNRDVYIGTGLSPRDYGPKHRCLAKNIVGIAGLWADIDVKHPVHKKQNLPNTYLEAEALVTGHGFDPTIIVDSGHGIQAWWLWKEIWDLGSTSERSAAEVLMSRLNAHLITEANKHQWAVDSVHDLSRILRIPGTINCKNGDDKEVTVTTYNESTRYNPEDIEKFLPEQYHIKATQPIQREIIEVQSQELIFDSEANPDFDDFMEMQSIFDPTFTETWKNLRIDMDDMSASNYDFSLAIFAAKVNWSKQATLNLLIAHRRRNGHDLKFDNKQYYTRSILRAKEFVKKDAEEELEANLEIVSDDLRTANSTPIITNKKAVILSANNKDQYLTVLKSKFGIDIVKFIRILIEEPIYEIILGNGKAIRIGTAMAVMNSNIVRAKIVDSTNLVMAPHKRKDWAKIVQMLFDIVEDQYISDEATDKGEIKSILIDYLIDKPKLTVDDAVEGKEPFVISGIWHLFLEKLFMYAKMQHGNELGKKNFATHMRALGCEYKKIDITLNGIRTTRSVWILPSYFTPL